MHTQVLVVLVKAVISLSPTAESYLESQLSGIKSEESKCLHFLLILFTTPTFMIQ